MMPDRWTYIARATQKLRTVCIRPLSHTADCEKGSSESNVLLHRGWMDGWMDGFLVVVFDLLVLLPQDKGLTTKTNIPYEREREG